MAETLRKTGSAVAAGTRSLVPPILSVALFGVGGIGIAFFGILADSEPAPGDEVSVAIIMGFTLLAVAVVWVGAVLALTVHFLGRHLGHFARAS